MKLLVEVDTEVGTATIIKDGSLYKSIREVGLQLEHRITRETNRGLREEITFVLSGTER